MQCNERVSEWVSDGMDEWNDVSWPAAYYTDCACHANVYLRNCTTSPTDNMYSSQHKQHQLPDWRSIRPHTATTQRMYTRAYHTNIHTFIRTSIYNIHANTTSTHTHTPTDKYRQVFLFTSTGATQARNDGHHSVWYTVWVFAFHLTNTRWVCPNES